MKKGRGKGKKGLLLLFLVIILSVFSFTPTLSRYVFNSIYYTITVGSASRFDITAIGPVQGTPRVNEILMVGPLTPSSATVTYQWMSSSSPLGPYTNITGATSSTYALTTNEYGKFIQVVATAYGNFIGSVTSAYAGPVAACPLASVQINGIASVGNSLSVTNLMPSGASATYLWMKSSDGTTWSSTGVTANTYNVLPSDLNYYIKVVATGTNGYTGSVSASTSSRIASTTISGQVAISGTPAVGSSLSANLVNLSPSGATVSYQWLKCNTPNGTYSAISGATGSSYTIQQGDEASYIIVKVTGNNGYTGTLTSGYYGPVASSLTSIGPISGSPTYGSTLTAGAVTPTGATFTYQWQRCDSANGTYADITGATSSTYTLTNGDIGYFIKVKAIATGTYTGSVTSSSVGPVTYPITSIASPTGTTQYGCTLTAGATAPFGATVTYQWKRGTTAAGQFDIIQGATSNTYTVTSDDIGKYIVVTAIGTGSYTGTVTSPSVGPVTKRSIDSVAVTGTLATGSTISAAVSPAGTSCSYQWYVSTNGSTWTAISGATSNSYTLLQTDYGKYIKVTVSGTGYYTGTLTSAYAGPVKYSLTSIGTPTGTPEYTGTLTAGEVAPSGATVTYQWQRGDSPSGPFSNISGATSNIYTLASSDIGKYIVVTAAGTGSYGGTVTSSSVGPIACKDLDSIDIMADTVAAGSPLTAVVAPADATCTYQWYISLDADSWTPISGSTSSTYILKQSDIGKYFKVTAAGTGYYTGTLTSSEFYTGITVIFRVTTVNNVHTYHAVSIEIKNNSNRNISNWILSFNYDSTLGAMWPIIWDNSGNVYTVRPQDKWQSNYTIPAGGSVTIYGNGSYDQGTKIWNVKVNGKKVGYRFIPYNG